MEVEDSQGNTATGTVTITIKPLSRAAAARPRSPV
jgi:hypothetical protein